MSDQRQMSEAEFPDEDPGDKAFGAAAADKEAVLDRAMGGDSDVEGLTDEPPDAQPRAAGKADPA